MHQISKISLVCSENGWSSEIWITEIAKTDFNLADVDAIQHYVHQHSQIHHKIVLPFLTMILQEN
jgi:hypothetical protein